MMAQSLNEIIRVVALLPLKQVMAAAAKANPVANIQTKSEAVALLADLIYRGTTDISWVQAQKIPADGAAPLKNVALANVIDQTVIEAAQRRADDATAKADRAGTEAGLAAKAASSAVAVASRAEAVALDAVAGVKAAAAAADVTAANLALLADDIRTIRERVGSLATVKIDSATVATAVAAAVAGAFAPFKKAVIDAGAEAAVGSLAGAVVVDRKPALDIFGIDIKDCKGNQVLVDIWNASDAPARDANWIWSEGILRYLLLAQGTETNLWFGGERGTGKSDTAKQFAAATGRSFVRINFRKHTAAEDYVGQGGLVGGSTVFEPGSFLRAFAAPSTVILLDEVTMAPGGELAPLNGFLEPSSAVSYGGAVRRRAPGVMVFAADNTLGNGDDSGRYAGTGTMNSSLIDRFSHVIAFKHLPFAQEVDAVVRHTGCTRKLAEHICSAIIAARAKVETGDIVDAPSIRSVVAFIRGLSILPIEDAWATAVVARQPSESATALEAIYAAYINTTLIAREIA